MPPLKTNPLSVLLTGQTNCFRKRLYFRVCFYNVQIGHGQDRNPYSAWASVSPVTIAVRNEPVCPWKTPLLSVTCSRFGKWLSKTRFHRRHRVFREERVKLDGQEDWCCCPIKTMKYDEIWDVEQSLVWEQRHNVCNWLNIWQQICEVAQMKVPNVLPVVHIHGKLKPSYLGWTSRA